MIQTYLETDSTKINLSLYQKYSDIGFLRKYIISGEDDLK